MAGALLCFFVFFSKLGTTWALAGPNLRKVGYMYSVEDSCHSCQRLIPPAGNTAALSHALYQLLNLAPARPRNSSPMGHTLDGTCRLRTASLLHLYGRTHLVQRLNPYPCCLTACTNTDTSCLGRDKAFYQCSRIMAYMKWHLLES
ncbi:hypothetical protein BJY00DRAFT_48744 [Aspergillus carlsbadensis]|nr:hypothetical protein BJY00DRAFT_48744 [Aspergillus carlsbadensis]